MAVRLCLSPPFPSDPGALPGCSSDLIWSGLILAAPFSVVPFTREEEAEAVRDPGRRAGVGIAGKNDGTQSSMSMCRFFHTVKSSGA